MLSGELDPSLFLDLPMGSSGFGICTTSVLVLPSKWNPNTKLPMLVTLRAGNTVDGPYRAQNDLVKVAEQRGYIVVTPMGYRGLSQPYYGSPYQIARPNAAAPAAGWTELENQR